jgi:DNA repair exonuclease SbcCD ATPase subunit
MSLIQRVSKYALISIAGVMLAACGSQKEPAQKLIAGIESTVTAASGEAQKYVPDQLSDVQSKLADLKASFDKQDYSAVVTGAPAVMSAASGLAAAAAAKKDEAMKALNDEWSSLSSSLPAAATAIQSRIDFLSKKSNRSAAKGIDLAAAKSSLADTTSLWSKAQAAFASGNLDEAVTAAKDVKGKIDALDSTLKIAPAAPAAAAQ